MKNHEAIIVAQLSEKNDLKQNKYSLAYEDICLVKANVFNQFWCGRLKVNVTYFTVQKIKFYFPDFFSKCIWSTAGNWGFGHIY